MGVLSINTDTTDELVAKLSRTGSAISSAKDNMDGGFSRLKGSDKLYGGIGKISNNFSVVGDRFSKLSRNISKHSNEIVETDLKLSKLADEIIIPEDLKTVDSAYNLEVNKTVLTKEDGKSIKNGSTEEQTYDDTSVVTKEDKLENINGSTARTSEFADEYSKEKMDLDDITKNSDNQVEEITDKTIINKEELDNIDNEIATLKVSLDDTYFDNIQGIDVEIPNEEDILKYLE